MQEEKMKGFVKRVLENMPSAWLSLTTHRLDIYDEKQAKTQFLDHFDSLYKGDNADASALYELPTAYDYIRLGHPLSCVLEWLIAGSLNINSQNVISFDSQTIPVMAILRKNKLENKNTQINYIGQIPAMFDAQTLKTVYGYQFELNNISSVSDISSFNGSTVFISQQDEINSFDLDSNVDFFFNYNANLGGVLLVNGAQNDSYISEIQHVRRRETIAMTPSNCLSALRSIVDGSKVEVENSDIVANKASLIQSIKTITEAKTKAVVASSGLSMQYAIVMGLIHDAQENHPGKAIKIIVPPNCYGGTNDQARRVAACIENVDVMDLPVDGGNDMVKSIGVVLDKIAKENAVPYIIAEIPTNPRVEVPNLQKLKEVLSANRTTSTGETAVDPVFILDQTFCPNVLFLGDNELLSTVRTISYVSGSKFPSGGLCTAGYCAANSKAAGLMEKIELHLTLCDNEATAKQYEFLAKQIPSMNQRIHDAYINTRDFVTFITETLPGAKINFVSEELASQGFTPSVFSLDLPTKGNTHEEREMYKRDLNLKLINLMITEIPHESKYCVSYGQLSGCYWTIPATSTQGTTKEGDKDYIARVALSANMDLDLHKAVFLKFVEGL